ncbi:ComEA family DNA-binding protein [Brevibacterium sp. 5221]|uniref:ComEA family DNA-binding protein n=1 Tax=Brevibacterium rongguiense TaxID=2695267 RepID=A0A6N9H9L3_9MICO|nr:MULTISPECIES: helix-hairpin-helix domain-containing protein [Brevibacterium]MYM20521.1 ComEA family DNA-binding protein [Brevibacterium rongguiense]WAL40995.1 helix-hairpin-helix domain-containing protein [Brevibacterium sp. BRM-1]
MAPSPDDRFAGLLDRSAARGWSPADDDDVDDLDDLLPRTRPVPRRTIIVVVSVLAVAAALAFFLLTRPRAPAAEDTAAPLVSDAAGGQAGGSGELSGAGNAGTAAAEASVHVVGAVRRPGVVRLPTGSRVADAITAAGGAQPAADEARVNLARRVVDGEQIVVPKKGEALAQSAPAATAPGGSGEGTGGNSGGGSGGSGGGSAGAPVNINTADETGLDALPGVGPATAQAIIGYREEHGAFASVDALTDVPGIGDATLEKLRPLVTV